MCLFVNPAKHPSMIPIPIQLERDLVVFKVLKRKNFKWLTPCMDMQIRFKCNECKCKHISFYEFRVTNDNIKAYDAYHSYTDINAAIKYSHGKHDTIFMAVIPKKSYVFYGNCGEICSNDLIIYKKKIKL